MSIQVNERVTVADKPLHGNINVLADGSVVSINSSVATVQIDGEDFPRDFKVDQLKSSAATYGAERTSHYDNTVVNAIRR